MRGVADAFGLDLENLAFNFSALYYGFALTGCSAAFYPPSSTAEGQGVLSRNFDFSTGTLMGKELGPKERPVCAQPYLVELHPDQGYASLALCCFDLLGGVVDGINSEGLCIALLADAELAEKYGSDPFFGLQPGFSELQILRFVLDTCANVEEAKDALLEAKLYYAIASNHYIVADRQGRAFIWENARTMHYGHIIEGGTEPLLTTNFSLHLHPDRDNLPAEFDRYCKMQERVAGHTGKYDNDFIKETSIAVSFRGKMMPEGYAEPRTIWHSIYFPEEGRVDVDFYLGEVDDPAALEEPKIQRSGYKTFKLVN
jgi:hypothetical protein